VVEERPRPVVIHRPAPRHEVDVRVERVSPRERERDWERGGSRMYDSGPDLAQRQRDLQRREEQARREAQWQRQREQTRREEPPVVEVRREQPRPLVSEPERRREVSESQQRLEQQPRFHQTLNGQGRMVVEQMKREAEQRRASPSESSSKGREAALSAARERGR
jgi:hypothetical protein